MRSERIHLSFQWSGGEVKEESFLRPDEFPSVSCVTCLF